MIVFDLPGHGASGHDPKQLGNFGSEGLDSVHASIAQHFQRFDNTLPNVLFGHSMGSAIALRYAQLHPHLQHLILCGVPYRSARLFQLAYHTAVIEKRIKGPNKESMLCSQTAKFNDCFAPNRPHTIGSASIRTTSMPTSPTPIAAIPLPSAILKTCSI